MTGEVLASRRQWAILTGCCLERLKELPDGCVSCCVTSPPYFALRAYLPAGHPDKAKEIGSEPTPAAFCATMVAVFEEVRRVLRDDGVLWLNLGDSFASKWPCSRRNIIGNGSMENGKREARPERMGQGLKEKDMIGIPWMTAFALREAGWYLRSDLPWVKRSAMPESVTDRPAKSLEYVFLLTKSPTYYFDMEAVKREGEPASAARYKSAFFVGDKHESGGYSANGDTHTAGMKEYDGRRNFRNTDLWFDSIDTPHGLCGIDDELVGLDVTSEALKEAHFAAFPTKLVEPLIKAGSSECGCCPCKIKKLKVKDNLTPEQKERVAKFLKRKGLL